MAAASLSSATVTATAAFIDTNLDTHLAVDVFDHDTASDLKKRIESEHRSCFPEFGHIHVHGIKVKRKGYSYQLADSMCVRNAFSGFKKSWYISVQVSALGDQLIPHGSPNQVVCHGVAENALVCHADNSASKRVSSLDNLQLLQSENKLDEGGGIHNVRPCVSEQTGEGDVKNLEKSAGNNEDGIPVHGSIPEAEERGFVNHEVLPSSSGTGIKDVCDVREDDLSISVPSSKTKQKRKRTREDAVPGDNSKDNDELPNLHIECAVVGSNKGIKEDSIELDEGMCKTAPATKKRKKSKRKKEDTVQYENEDNIASVDTPPSMNNSQVPLLEKKLDRNEEVPVVGKVVKNLEIDVKSSGNNDPGISLTSSLPEAQVNCCVNHELPNSHIECAVDGSDKGIKEDSIVPDEGMCKTAPATKKRKKSKRKKEDTVQYENEDNMTSSMNNSQVPLLEKKQDENEEVPVVGKVVKNLQIDVKSSGNNDLGISLTSSLPETRDNCCVNHELPNSHIECAVDGPNKGIKEDSIVPDEGMCTTAPATKKRKKSKRKKEDTVQYENEDNIASVDNPPSRSSKKTSSMNNSHVPLLVKKQDENEEVPVVGKVVKNLEIDVKSSGNNDPGISLTSSLPETRDSCCVNHELPNSHIECAVDGSNKGIKEDSIVPDDGICKTALATKKRHKSKREKEDTVQGDNSKDNIASVDNPPRSPSSMNNSQVPLLEKKQDENEEVPVVGNVVKKLEIDVKSSGNNDPDISFTRSLPETRDNCCVNHELPNSHIECVVDGSNKGIKEGSVVPDEGMCKTPPATKKRQKSKREKEDTVQGDNTKDNITSVDNPLSSPPQRASSLKNFHMPQLENKQTVGAEEECDVPKIHPDKKVHKVHKTRQDAKMSSPSDSAMSSVKVNSKPRKSASGESMDLDKRREHLLISNSKLESSNKMVKDKAGKASGNNVWGVVSNIQQRKSLLAGGIFKDDNSWTSQDEADNSDVSTRTRSDNSLMSDSSDGDSSSDLDSQHGAYGGDRMENGGGPSLKASLSSTKGMPIELLLKSSSMFKKAKIRTSQLDETESQPEFVPDSLAD
ncbi:uncharacterized protein LOC130709922 [Lotus japonicus]|uniref:uncharacterized protein LOC130709922 n=1 Tax=Lotus japonicus TaxID=34305 RepID=UPI002584367D|nr:uncharacterized protein LOC130709922 [Lotus japonicus]